MAKKAKSSEEAGVNKSQIIRDFVKENPGQGPTAIASALNASHGWNISPAYVSTIKNKASGGRRGRRGRPAKDNAGSPGRPGRPGRRPGTSSKATGSSVDAATLIQVKELARKVGGLDNARAAIDLLAKLSD